MSGTQLVALGELDSPQGDAQSGSSEGLSSLLSRDETSSTSSDFDSYEHTN